MRRVIDESLKVTKALPADDSTVASDGIDLKIGDKSDFVAGVDVRVEAPALATGQLGDAATMTYDLYHDDDAAFGSETKLAEMGVQTGAGGAGDAAAEYRIALPTNVKRYIRAKATNSADVDASGASLTLSLVF